MFLRHLIVGMLCGTIAAIFVWQAGHPAWLMASAYSLMGSFGVLVSTVAHLAIAHIRENRGRGQKHETNKELLAE